MMSDTAPEISAQTWATAIAEILSKPLLAFPNGLSAFSLEFGNGPSQVRVVLSAASEMIADSNNSGAILKPKWNVPGHQLVAKIAEDLLQDESQDTLRAAMAIIAADPDPKRSQAGDFSDYAAWPDTNKSDPAFKSLTGSWHYVDIVYDPRNPQSYPPTLPAEPHLLSAIRDQLEMLRSGSDVDKRAAAFAFILHFVGDIHQPLHCAELHNGEFPNGDRGGNSFTLAQGKNLHSLWDGLLTVLTKDLGGSSSRLRHKYKRSDFAAELAKSDPAQWAWESHVLARVAYDEILAEPVESRASKSYIDKAITIAERQAMLGAYRLSSLLRTTLVA